MTTKALSQDAAMDFYGADFFAATEPDEWKNILRSLNGKLGEIQSFEMVDWNVSSTAGSGGGTYAVLIYRTNRTKYRAQETLTLTKRPGDTEFKVVAHNITSQGLLSVEPKESSQPTPGGNSDGRADAP